MRQVHLPLTLAELWPLLDAGPRPLLFAGGTDLFVKMRADKADSDSLIGLERIAELNNIEETDDEIRIGACVTHEEIMSHSLVAKHLPIIAKALSTLGSPPIRAMGTIGGNICTASPAGDTLPPLYVLQAEVEISDRKNSRTLPIGDFITGPGETCLRPGEIVTAVRLKKPREYNLHHFEKVGQRKSMACAIASMAALLEVSPSGMIERARLAWGSVAPTVLRDKGIEEFLVGKHLSKETLSAAAERVALVVAPIDDIRASAYYRRTVSCNLLTRLAVYADVNRIVSFQ